MARKRIVLPDGSTALVSEDVEGLDLSLPADSLSPSPTTIVNPKEEKTPVRLSLYLWKTREYQEFQGEFFDLTSCSLALNQKERTMDLTVSFNKEDATEVCQSVWKVVLALRAAAVDLKVLKVGSTIEAVFEEDVKLLLISVTNDHQLKFKFLL